MPFKPQISPNPNRVAILLSTYNGEKYIRDQIQSILDQIDELDNIYIRDDGSKDKTIEIIKSIQDKRINLTTGLNIGFSKSFTWLIYHTPDDYGMYMFCDQDDIWLPGKVLAAKAKLASSKAPKMYCSRLSLVNENLKYIGSSPDYMKEPSFWNALCENIATGCTIAFNNAALQILKHPPHKEISQMRIYYHDWWTYLVISYFGEVHFDNSPKIWYRQHQNNQVGMGRGIARYWRIFLTVTKTSWVAIMLDQIYAFFHLYQDMIRKEDHEILQKLANERPMKKALTLITESRLIRQLKFGKTLFRILVIHDYLKGNIK